MSEELKMHENRPLLEIKDLSIEFRTFDGVVKAVNHMTFSVPQGKTIGLVGETGAGKTTILHTITGLIAPKSGQILFEGVDLTKTPAHKIVAMGMAHVPEGRRIFQ